MKKLLGVLRNILFLMLYLRVTHGQSGIWRQLPRGVMPESMYFYSDRGSTVAGDDRLGVCNNVRENSWLADILTTEEHYGINAAFPFSDADREDADGRYYFIGLMREVEDDKIYFRWLKLTREETCYTNWRSNGPDRVHDTTILFGRYEGLYREQPYNYIFYDFGTARWDGHWLGNRTYHYLCEAPNSCHLYCLNGGTCILNENTGNVLECVCTNHTTGPRCEESVSCRSNPCLNGATCMEIGYGFQCDCGPYLTGIRCETDINECAPENLDSFCPMPGGRCGNRFNQAPECRCESGFVGPKCDLEVKGCDVNPCRNGGTCIPNLANDNNVDCQCDPAYTGTYCEYGPYRCLPNPCQNGGTCNEELSEFVCICPHSHTGSTCEQDVDECTEYNYCSTYNCRNTDGSYLCDCPVGYTGPLCNVDLNECITYPNSCYGRGTCKNTDNGYTCECMDNYDPSRFCAVPIAVQNAVVAGQADTSASSQLSLTDVAGVTLIVVELLMIVGLTYVLLCETVFSHKPIANDAAKQVCA